MNIVKKILSVLFWLLIIALLIAPIGLIVQISREEMQEFATPDPPVLQEVAIGGIYQAQSTSIFESFQVSGKFVSNADGYMEMNYDTVRNARWKISVGSEIQKGMVIGTADGEDIIATMDGIVKQMHIAADDCYIKLELFAPVVLETKVDAETMSILRNSRKLTAGDKKGKVSLVFASRQQNSDGTFNVRIFIDSDEFTYGQMATVYIYTGRTNENVVAVNHKCIYHKGGSQWYMRKVTKEGIFVEEVAVEVVYQDDTNAYVTGIGAGEYFDSGYQIIAGG